MTAPPPDDRPPSAVPSSLVDLDHPVSFDFSAPATIGRHPGCDLVLDHPRVSSLHAVLEWDGRQWSLRDLGSRNGTSVNKRRVRQPCALREGDVIRFAGSIRWQVERLCHPAGDVAVNSTEPVCPREATTGLEMELAFAGPDEGTVRVRCLGDEWSVTTGQRFVLLYLLAREPGEWMPDETLKVGLWGAAGRDRRVPSALHKLLFDTRKMFAERGIDGWFIEKKHGQTRLALSPEQVRVLEDTHS